MKVYETGARVLESVPDKVQTHTTVQFAALPRILASCDALVKDQSTGKPGFQSF